MRQRCWKRALLDAACAAATGSAMRAPANPRLGTVIGRAMQPLRDAEGTIPMLVTLR